ncbi:ssDNA binding protein [Gordonia phage Kabocha]|uniref:SsDNA binding protein n=1 Tax=Gordonia phage Chidiebere TaxID=2656530 RepID=A0A649VLQ6_9CAUD|nr:ssDNA binding protein [Gordonia phage Chidiebere]AZS07942.1 ssDNA binding protein [Gordonia phage Gray]WAA19876.1 ssDNA binding protein [Gordonia phage Kabocha]WAA20065.1 ssDNA binding protein [Gordonia phage Hanem]WNM67108.1 ssDNA binding protein [Gordonia Phage Schomber]QGJ92979.1 ssDNA binding protein [Gordonia phage Chidiebere]
MALKVKAEKAGSIKSLKASLKRGGAGTFIKNVPKDSGIVVRFLTEPDEWVKYREYYSENTEPRYFPDVEGMDPDFVADLDKPSTRYLACAVDVDENSVIPIKMPKSLVESLMKKYDKYGTILDRDYELVKDGEGFDTSYEAIPEAPKRRNMKAFEVLDLMDVLEKQLPKELVGDDDEEDDPPFDMEDDDEKPMRRRRGSRTGGGTTSSKRTKARETEPVVRKKKQPVKKARSTSRSSSSTSSGVKRRRPLRKK